MAGYGAVVEEAVDALNAAGLDVGRPRDVTVVEDAVGLDGETVHYAAATDRVTVYADALGEDVSVYDGVEAGLLDRWYVDQVAGAPGAAYLDAVGGLDEAYEAYLDAAGALRKPFFIDTDRERFATRFEAEDMRKHGLVRAQDIVTAGIVRAADEFADIADEVVAAVEDIDDASALMQAQLTFKQEFNELRETYEEDIIEKLAPVWERDEASREIAQEERTALRRHWATYTETDMDAGTFRGFVGRDLAYAPFEPYEENDGAAAMRTAALDRVGGFFERWDARQRRVRRRSRGGRDLAAVGAFFAEGRVSGSVEADGRGDALPEAVDDGGEEASPGVVGWVRSCLGW